MITVVANPGHPYDRWRVRIPNNYGDPTDTAVHIDVDLTTELMTMRLPNGNTTTIDPVTARAVKDCLAAAIFTSLGAPGPWLHTERHDSTTWHHPGHR